MAENSTMEWTKLVLTTVVGTAAFVVGFIQYASTSSLSVRQPYLEKQMELCLTASEHAARLATTRDMAQWDRSWEEFWMLYWGPLAITEEAGTDSLVANRMIVFGDRLKPYVSTPPVLPVAGLTQPSIDIAHSCSDLIQSKWRTGFLGWIRF